MTNTTVGSLRELQRIDDEIRRIRSEVEAFDPLLAEVEEPALALEEELKKGRERLAQMQADARRLERSADDKQERARRLDERLNQVSNLREEAAVRTELDLVKRAIENDEHEALQLIEQVRRAELAMDELDKEAQEARASVEPRQEEMLQDRAALRDRLSTLKLRRDTILDELDGLERRVYESFHASGRNVVVASLTQDGACGACFGMVPLQLQNEIRGGGRLLRCEACGVILTDEPEPPAPDEGPGEAEVEALTEPGSSEAPEGEEGLEDR